MKSKFFWVRLQNVCVRKGQLLCMCVASVVVVIDIKTVLPSWQRFFMGGRVFFYCLCQFSLRVGVIGKENLE